MEYCQNKTKVGLKGISRGFQEEVWRCQNKTKVGLKAEGGESRC